MRSFFTSFLALFFLLPLNLAAQDNPNVEPVKAQLEAYNKRDVEAFLVPYSDSIRIYNFPDQLIYRGKEAMRKTYGRMFKQLPDLHCKILNRQILGNVVIDHERVTFEKGESQLEVLAMYIMKDAQIAEVYFIRPEKEKE